MDFEIKIENTDYWNAFKSLYGISHAGNFMALRNKPDIANRLGLEYVVMDHTSGVHYIFRVIDKQKWLLAKIKYGI